MTQPTSSSQQRRRQQIQQRDRTADGSFIYAVITTGVYCRPSCPSRHAKAENLRFFDNAAQARAAGFRPCLRCKPDEAAGDAQQARITQLCRLIEQAEQPPTLQQLADAAGLSRWHLQREFRKATGLSPAEYARAVRQHRLQQQLAHAGSTTDAALAAGYNSASHFYAQAPTELGMSAATYRQGGQQQRIGFATGPCSLGRVLVAQSDAGVCAILLGDSDAELERDLRARFAKAECLADNTLGKHLAAVVALIETPHSAPPLPLDIRGTAFQRRVWQALQAIPPGQTRSYSELAHAMGTPSAARAVAGACAANPLAIAVPCHRIVRGDGSLSGYRWGVERKRALLQREALDTTDD